MLVGADLYERSRIAVRTASFVQVRGRAEARDGMMRMVVATAIEAITPLDVTAMPQGKSWG